MSPSAQFDSQLCFKAFLSHRYKSSDVNLYFFQLFSKFAEVQFEVDEGKAATCVTKLERMIHDSEAFIGVYPFPGTMEESQDLEQLRIASRYFRLEIDLAIRAQKPAIIFHDRRYGNLLRVPPGIMRCAFDTREVSGTGGSPRAETFEMEFARFCQRVKAHKQQMAISHRQAQGKVGVFVPHGTSTGYQPKHIEAILAVLVKHGCDEVEVVSWPFALDPKMLSTIDSIDWAIVDIGVESAATGIPAFLHGRFTPTVRLQSDPSASPYERALTTNQEVGYQKDIIRWDNVESLKDQLNNRVISLLFERQPEIRRFSVSSEAESYFRSAAKFKENVFISYSGKNRDTAFGISDAFKRRFRDVFNYRDGESIRPGQPWLPEIFGRLATSAIGVPLLSSDYFESGNCVHEAQEMVARRDSGKMKVIPIKISEETFDLPPWIGALQYERLSAFPSPDEVVRRVVDLVGLAN